jgi:hypothetical protein
MRMDPKTPAKAVKEAVGKAAEAVTQGAPQARLLDTDHSLQAGEGGPTLLQGVAPLPRRRMTS